jgi:hypothetical protein
VKAREPRERDPGLAREASAAVAGTADVVAGAGVHPSSPVRNPWATGINSCRLEAATAPCRQVGRSFATWQKLEASPWLVRQLRFGFQLPWTSEVSHQRPRSYPLTPVDRAFAVEELVRWVDCGFARRAAPA